MSEPGQSRPKGTLDFVPPEAASLRRVEDVFRRIADCYGFSEIITPTFEHTEVFVKSSGVTSDIVTKEMYRFRDRSDRDLTLRPEGTPGVIRALVENRVRLPCRLCYVGPYFRYSRPQKGRYREFHQLGVEAIGEASPETDAEVIACGVGFFAALGITDCATRVNSIGCAVCRPAYRERLVAFLSGRRAALCPDCQARIDTNPMRVFDCKSDACRAATVDAPAPRRHLCPDCAAHFQGVLTALAARGIGVELDDRLVRGLDYYSRTTFEYVSAALGAQDSLGGGGRYDYLVGSFGGPATPAVGFALGLERTLLALPPAPAPGRLHLCYIVWLTQSELPAARALADRLRRDGVACRIDYDAKKPGRQFKSADAANAACCVVVGPDELTGGFYSLKDLGTGEQSQVPADAIIPAVRALFHN
jgi:histidyl-tRNA synthetase